jgi:hypothetical protein
MEILNRPTRHKFKRLESGRDFDPKLGQPFTVLDTRVICHREEIVFVHIVKPAQTEIPHHEEVQLWEMELAGDFDENRSSSQ